MTHRYLTSDAIVALSDELRTQYPNALEEDRWAKLPSDFSRVTDLKGNCSIVKNIIRMGGISDSELETKLKEVVHTVCAKKVELSQVKAAQSMYDVFGLQPELPNGVVAGCLESIAINLVDIYFKFSEEERKQIRESVKNEERPSWIPVSVIQKLDILREIADEKMFSAEYDDKYFWTYLINEVNDRVKTTRSHRIGDDGNKLQSPHTLIVRKAFYENS